VKLFSLSENFFEHAKEINENLSTREGYRAERLSSPTPESMIPGINPVFSSIRRGVLGF
jgi:hypothetical protein